MPFEKAIQAVNISVEMNFGFLADEEKKVLREHFGTIDPMRALVDIAGTLEQFYKLIKYFDTMGCSQKLISHLKHARDMGARFVIANLSGETNG